MRRLLGRLTAAVLVVALGGAAAAATWAWRTLERRLPQGGEPAVVVVEPGQGAAAILARLEAAGVLADARLARLYLTWWLDDPPLRAGEYRFDEPATTREVLDKLIRGAVVTYPVTVIEGLTVAETAAVLAERGFGDTAALRREMGRAELVADLDPEATDLEGYLYPDTYHFARGTPEAEVVATMVRTFRRRLRDELTPVLPDPGSLRRVVTLASIVEKEARIDEERPLIAGVYANRLARGIALYADPTVIYALKRRGSWDGNLRRPDLELDSPYNTYVHPGLPPGPICSPGLPSLLAAARPADVPYLYFVSRNDGSHAFAETLRDHNRNVERWQRQYWRRRWAAEGRGR